MVRLNRLQKFSMPFVWTLPRTYSSAWSIRLLVHTHLPAKTKCASGIGKKVRASFYVLRMTDVALRRSHR